MAWNLHAIEQRCGARDIWLPHRSRRHLAQLVDVRVAQIVDVRVCDHDLLFARVLTYARDALSSLQRLCGRAARTEGLTHFIVRHPQHFTMAIR